MTAFSKSLKDRVITHGRSEAVLIPREFWFTVDHVYIQRDPRTGDLILSARAPDFEAERDQMPPVERDWRDS